MRTRGTALLLLLLAALGCSSPTAPTLADDGSCTMVGVFGTTDPRVSVRVQSCFRVCPADAEATALARGESLVHAYLCPSGVA